MTQSQFGTLLYMAPELRKAYTDGKRPRCSSLADAWSIGAVILACCICGTGSEFNETINRYHEGKVPAKAWLGHHSTIIDKLLTRFLLVKKSSRRHIFSKDFVVALERLQDRGNRAAVRSQTTFERATSFIRASARSMQQYVAHEL